MQTCAPKSSTVCSFHFDASTSPLQNPDRSATPVAPRTCRAGHGSVTLFAGLLETLHKLLASFFHFGRSWRLLTRPVHFTPGVTGNIVRRVLELIESVQFRLAHLVTSLPHFVDERFSFVNAAWFLQGCRCLGPQCYVVGFCHGPCARVFCLQSVSFAEMRKTLVVLLIDDVTSCDSLTAGVAVQFWGLRSLHPSNSPLTMSEAQNSDTFSHRERKKDFFRKTDKSRVVTNHSVCSIFAASPPASRTRKRSASRVRTTIVLSANKQSPLEIQFLPVQSSQMHQKLEIRIQFSTTLKTPVKPAQVLGTGILKVHESGPMWLFCERATTGRAGKKLDTNPGGELHNLRL